MATMASVLLTEEETRASQLDDYGRRDVRVDPQVRAFPNEDILFWRKPSIDNGRVVRQADPKVWEACWRFFSAASVVVVVVVGLLLPNAYGLLSGIRLQQLQDTNDKLREEKKRLELVESRLTSPERLEELSLDLELEPVTPERVHYLRGVGGIEEARLDQGPLAKPANDATEPRP